MSMKKGQRPQRVLFEYIKIIQDSVVHLKVEFTEPHDITTVSETNVIAITLLILICDTCFKVPLVHLGCIILNI